MTILGRSLIKFILSFIAMCTGIFTSFWLATEYNQAFILLAVLIFFGGAHYGTWGISCPKCGAPMFARFFLKGLFVMPWIGPECYKCGQDFREK